MSTVEINEEYKEELELVLTSYLCRDIISIVVQYTLFFDRSLLEGVLPFLGNRKDCVNWDTLEDRLVNGPAILCAGRPVEKKEDFQSILECSLATKDDVDVLIVRSGSGREFREGEFLVSNPKPFITLECPIKGITPAHVLRALAILFDLCTQGPNACTHGLELKSVIIVEVVWLHDKYSKKTLILQVDYRF